MKRKIKLGDKVKLTSNIIVKTMAGDETFLKGTIGVVCDADNPECPTVELKNSNGDDTWAGFNATDLEIIE